MKSNSQFIRELQINNPQMIPLEEYKGAREKILFKCANCGNIEMKIASAVLRGHKCSICAGNKKRTHEEFVQLMADAHPTIRVRGKYISSQDKLEFECLYCGNIWSTRAGRILIKGAGCPTCNKYVHTSFPEQAIYYYLLQAFPDTINSYKEEFGKSELDCYIPSLKTGIEYDGKLFHRNKEKSELRKYNICKELGIYLIRIRESGDSEFCDKCILTKYSNNDFCNLDSTINELLSFLNPNHKIEINSVRDQYKIKEMYFGRRYKNSLLFKYPQVAAEWYQQKNGNITPDMVSAATNDKYYFKCPQCQHIYEASVSHRTLEGTGCPKCAGNTRKTIEEFKMELAALQPDIVLLSEYRSAFEKVKCKCSVCNHLWEATPDSLRRGGGCPKCANNIRKTQDSFVAEVNKVLPTVEILGEYINYTTPLQCQCKVCGHLWKPQPSSLLHSHGCPHCSGNNVKRVKCVEKNLIFDNAQIASREFGVSVSAIQNCCRGVAKTSGGYHWIYVDNNIVCENISRKSTKKVRCAETNTVYKSARDAASELGISPSAISNCCRGIVKTSGGFHWSYVSDPGEKISNRRKQYTGVKCIETNVIYANAKAAADAVGVCVSAIQKCCLGKANISGGYHWVYMTEKGEDKRGEFIEKKLKRIKCEETGVIYESVGAAEKELGISSKAIRNCCNGKSKTSGGFHWSYLVDNQ